MTSPEKSCIPHSQLPETEKKLQVLSLVGPKDAFSSPIIQNVVDGIKQVDEEAFDQSIWLGREQINQAVTNNRGALWIATERFPSTGTPLDPHNIVGYILLEFSQESSAYAAGIGVRNEWRRHHIGTKLANAALWCAFMVEKVQEVTMTMRVNNAAIRAGGETMGVKIRRPLGSDFPDGEARDELVLTREDWMAQAKAQGINLETSRSLID